jgi:hypothetical protein
MPWASDGGNAWNATKCVPVDPKGGEPGDPCIVYGSAVSGVDSCVLSAMCWDVDPATNEGICIPFCGGSPANPVCDDPGWRCSISHDGTLILCLPFCDPLEQDCPDGAACYGFDTSFVCLSEGQAGAYGDPCEFANACDPGLACVDASDVPGCTDVGCCSPYCDLSDQTMPCPGAGAGQECVPWFDEGTAPSQYANLGICVVPEGA